MGVFYETIPKSLEKWIMEQKLFWIASAPLSGDGHVNVSPKGGAYFGIIDERTFWYMDLTGSGIETTSHLHEPGNGRITVLFNAFEGPPRIMRLWGKGTVLERGTPNYDEFIANHSVQTLPGTRSIIIVDIHQVGTSCGFSVPFFDFKEHRLTLNNFYEKRLKDHEAGKPGNSMDEYWAYKNAWSMDNLPGMVRGNEYGRKEKVTPIKKMIGPHAPTTYSAPKAERDWTLIAVVAVVCFLLGIIAKDMAPIPINLHLPVHS